MHSEAELYVIAKELGLTDDCAKDMVKEHIERESYVPPLYVRAALNSARSDDGKMFKINCKKTQKFLDRRFGYNACNIHEFLGFSINRHKLTNKWYIF